MPVPVLVQVVMSTVNDLNGIVGNNFTYPLPNPVLAGNCLAVSASYPAGTFSSIGDTNGTWPGSPTATVTDGSNMASSWFILPNAAAGTHTITLNLTGSTRPVQFSIMEFNNIATSSPADGSVGASALQTTAGSPSSLSAGSYTPTTNNDANGGHLILTYLMANDTVGTGTTSYATALATNGSQIFVDADNATSLPHATSYFVQATNGAINPGFTLTQAAHSFNGTGFNCLSVALKIASAGSAPSNNVRIIRLLHTDSYAKLEAGAGTFPVCLPSSGNTLLVTAAANTALFTLAGVTDSLGQTYTKINDGGGAFPQCFYKTSANSSPNLVTTLNISVPSGTQCSFRLYDIANGGAFDTSAGFNGAYNGPSPFNDAPDFTPGVAPGITIAILGLGAGPTIGLAAGSPAASVWDSIAFTGNNDNDQMENADGLAHIYHSTTASQRWNWTMQAGLATPDTAFAIAFSFAQSASLPPPGFVPTPQMQAHLLPI